MSGSFSQRPSVGELTFDIKFDMTEFEKFNERFNSLIADKVFKNMSNRMLFGSPVPLHGRERILPIGITSGA